MCNFPVHILLAEDHQEDVTLILSLLGEISEAQYKVEQVQTYDAVLEGLAHQRYDVCLISSCLGQPHGLELLSIQDIAQYQAGIIVLGSAQDQVGMAGFLSNPNVDFLYKAELTGSLLRHAIHQSIHRIQLASRLNQVLQEKQQLIVALDLLQKNTDRYQLAFQGINDGIWDWNLETGAICFSPQSHFPQSCSPQSQWSGESNASSYSAESWFERIHSEDLYWVKRAVNTHLEGLNSQFRSEYRILNSTGEYGWILSRGQVIRNGSGQPIRIVGVQIDVTELKQSEEKSIRDAFYDSLTGLPNRMSLVERLRSARELATHKRDYLFAILFIDLDRFKMINDSLGHATGDLLLNEIAARLSLCLRPDDTIARLGGDEFAILLEDVKTRDNAIAIAERISYELSLPFSLDGREIFTSASIGITFSTTEFDHPEDLLRDADLAMYRAKTQGRGRYEVFHPRMHTSAMALLEMENDLRRAVERQELQLYYQPIVSLRTNRLVGFEALLRWQHPQQGWISPDKFVPIAEETGLIVPIGNWVLREACLQMRKWQQQFPEWQPLTVNVNLSGKQFTPYLVEQVHQILQATQLEGQYLKLEITESVLMGSAESAISTLAQLKQLGIQLAIDDFGTGYSSLSYLHRFPIDTLKVDRSFINKIDVDGEQLAIVRTIITLAWNLGMEVVAEGVETPKQLSQLRSLRCEYAQGYLFSRPCDPDAIAKLLLHEGEVGHLQPPNVRR